MKEIEWAEKHAYLSWVKKMSYECKCEVCGAIFKSPRQTSNCCSFCWEKIHEDYVKEALKLVDKRNRIKREAKK